MEKITLSDKEIRILGCLMEKEKTTPDSYPLTVNSLLNACNQKTGRDPVMQLDNQDIETALDSLTRKDLAEEAYNDGGYAVRYQHCLDRAWELSDRQQALMALLMLRGSQTVGELKARTARLYDFAGTAELEQSLNHLCDRARPLAVRIPRKPGQKENRYDHLLYRENAGEEKKGPTIIINKKSSASPAPVSPAVRESLVELAPEVREAVASGRGVVALESTIISHGMPYPQNVETALEVEKIVRSEGAVPATIALMNGKFKVGLSADEIDMLGKTGRDVIKCSRRDLPFVLARKLPGATTVAATMIGAALGGVKMFATGGIGGVHRGAPATFDISADLDELARTDVAVVCAGAKAILDLPLTLEYLETRGVPVVGYGTEELPAFYTRTSGLNVDYRIDSPEELARALDIKWRLGLTGGVVIANPIPQEYSMDPDLINGVIDRALGEMEAKGIRGKESTPFLLARISELTEGDSLYSNIKLVFNNARLASKTALELAKL